MCRRCSGDDYTTVFQFVTPRVVLPSPRSHTPIIRLIPAQTLCPHTRTKHTLNTQNHTNQDIRDEYEQPQISATAEQNDDSQWEEEEADLTFYQEKFHLPRERKYRAPRKPKNACQRFEEHRAAVENLAEDASLENVWEITYTPARFEDGFLKDSLQPFYMQNQIVDVMTQVKGGKEANVYRCRAHPSMAVEWIAAKVYRPRRFRNLRNDSMYREGRQILSSEDDRPQAIKPRDERILRAVDKKTAFGVQVQHTSWLMYEFSTLQILHMAGAPVPMPYGVGENAILMAYIGDEQRAAPTLHEVQLEDDEAGPLFQKTIQSVKLMLQKGFVHGDLSAYNILYWKGEITLIDFPQVTDVYSNRNAQTILGRDVKRVCQYFQHYGIRANHRRLAAEMWERYAALAPDDLAADLSWYEFEQDSLE